MGFNAFRICMWIHSMVKSWPLYPRYYFLQSIEISLGIFILVLWRIVLVKFEAEGKIFEITRTIHSNSKRSEQFFIKFIYSEKATTFCKMFTLLLSYVLPVKNKGKIPQNFVAFSEYNDCFFTCSRRFLTSTLDSRISMGRKKHRALKIQRS